MLDDLNGHDFAINPVIIALESDPDDQSLMSILIGSRRRVVAQAHAQVRPRAQLAGINSSMLKVSSKFPSRPSPSRSGLRGFWMRRTPCGPSAASPSPSSTPSSNPPSSTCSATPSPIRWGGRSATLGELVEVQDGKHVTVKKAERNDRLASIPYRHAVTIGRVSRLGRQRRVRSRERRTAWSSRQGES